MTPFVVGGQSGCFAHGAQYSEGATIVTDPEGNEVGRGFGESVTHADTVHQMIRLAGLPVTEEMGALLQAAAPSRQHQAESMAYLLAHQDELNEVIASCTGI